MLELADDAGDVALEVLGDAAGLLVDAVEGADAVIEGVRRAGLRRLVALVIVVAAAAAIFGWLRSREDSEPAPTV